MIDYYARSKFDQDFTNIVIAKKKTINQWDQVPFYWFRRMREKGWIALKQEEKLEIYKEAKTIAKIEIQKRSSSRSNEGNCILSVDELAKIIAGKIAVFRFVVKNDTWEPPR